MAAAAAYPPPPPFYKLYKDYGEKPESAPAPPPPVVGTYIMFGSTYTTDHLLPSLEEEGLRQLYSKGAEVDYRRELKQLNSELMLNMLELADVLVERPSQYARRVEDMGLILKNIHHLLNSLRPHQARATLIHLLEAQIKRRKEEIEDIRRSRQEARLAVQAILDEDVDSEPMKQAAAASLPVVTDFTMPNSGNQNYGFGAPTIF